MLYLLKNGASPTDIKGNTIIHYLSCTDYIELLDVVFQDYSNLASSQNINGQTPLMWAVNSGNIRSVQYLIMQGVDLDVTDYSGKSAYDYAVNKGYDEIAKLLKACPEQGTVLREPG